MINAVEIIEYLENYMACIKSVKEKKLAEKGSVVNVKSLNPDEIYANRKIKKALWKNDWVTFQDPFGVIQYIYNNVPRNLFFESLANFNAYGTKNNRPDITKACKKFITTHINEAKQWMELSNEFFKINYFDREMTLNKVLQVKNFDFSFLRKVNIEIKKLWKKYVFFNDAGEEFWNKDLASIFLGVKKSKLLNIAKKENWKIYSKDLKKYLPAKQLKSYKSKNLEKV